MSSTERLPSCINGLLCFIRSWLCMTGFFVLLLIDLLALRVASDIAPASSCPKLPKESGCIVIAEMSSSKSAFKALHFLQALRSMFQELSSFPLGTNRLPITCSLVLVSLVSSRPQYTQETLCNLTTWVGGSDVSLSFVEVPVDGLFMSGSGLLIRIVK